MAMTPIALEVPDFPPELLGTQSAYSRSTGEEYQVNTRELTCTCPDFQYRRSQHPPRSVARICKHLGRALRDCGALEDHRGELIAAVIREGRGREEYRTGKFGPEAEFVVGSNPGTPWIDVFARKYRGKDEKGYPTGPWVGYGFNLEEWRWSYGESPRGASKIKEVLTAEFGRPRSGDGASKTQAKEDAESILRGCFLIALILAFLLLAMATCAIL